MHDTRERCRRAQELADDEQKTRDDRKKSLQDEAEYFQNRSKSENAILKGMEDEAARREQIKTDFMAQVARSRSSAAADFRNAPGLAQLEALLRK